MELPSTVDEYYSKLGSNTRETIKNRRVRLMRDYPDAKFVAKFGPEIDQTVVNIIVQLSIERLKIKGRIPKIDNMYIENLYKYSQHYGFVSYLEIDGVIVEATFLLCSTKGFLGV